MKLKIINYKGDLDENNLKIQNDGIKIFDILPIVGQ